MASREELLAEYKASKLVKGVLRESNTNLSKTTQKRILVLDAKEKIKSKANGLKQTLIRSVKATSPIASKSIIPDTEVHVRSSSANENQVKAVDKILELDIESFSHVDLSAQIELKVKLESKTLEVEQLMTINDKLSLQLQSLTTELAEYTEEHVKLQDLNSLRQQNLVDKERLIASLANVVEQLRVQIKELNDRPVEHATQWISQVKIQELEELKIAHIEKIQDQSQIISSLESRLSDNQLEVHELRNRNNQLLKLNVDLEGDKAELQNEFLSTKEQFCVLNAEFRRELESNSTSAAQRSLDIESERSQIMQLKGIVNGQKSEIIALESDLKDLYEATELLESNTDENNELITKYKQQIEESQTIVIDLETKLAFETIMKDQEIERLNVSLRSILAENESFCGKLETQRVKILELDVDVAALTEATELLDELEEQNERTKISYNQKIVDLESQIIGLETKVAKDAITFDLEKAIYLEENIAGVNCRKAIQSEDNECQTDLDIDHLTNESANIFKALKLSSIAADLLCQQNLEQKELHNIELMQLVKQKQDLEEIVEERGVLEKRLLKGLEVSAARNQELEIRLNNLS